MVLSWSQCRHQFHKPKQRAHTCGPKAGSGTAGAVPRLCFAPAASGGAGACMCVGSMLPPSGCNTPAHMRRSRLLKREVDVLNVLVGKWQPRSWSISDACMQSRFRRLDDCTILLICPQANFKTIQSTRENGRQEGTVQGKMVGLPGVARAGPGADAGDQLPCRRDPRFTVGGGVGPAFPARRMTCGPTK